MHNLVYVDLEYTPTPDDFTGGRWQPWRIIIKSGDNRADMFKSTEAYTNEADARHAIDLAFGPNAIVYLRQAEHGNQLIRHPEPWPAEMQQRYPHRNGGQAL